jgi:glycosyltransferase involved in cell wall biosynthesis
MRIAFFCKRRYTGKDVVADRFGRLYEMPRFLAERGHRVRAYCLDYHGDEKGAWTHALASGSIHWEALPARVRRPASLAYIPARMLHAMRDYTPDVLMGASDIPSVALTGWLAGRLGVPYAIDLYDNFESFGQARIPGFRTALRAAARRASLVTTVSDPLAEHAIRRYGLEGEVITIANGVSPQVFHPMDKATARARLGLPPGAKLVGTAGGLSRGKGVDVLYSAWQRLAERDRDVHLVLAGPLSPSAPLPVGDRVHYLGNLPHRQVATLFGALDVGVVTLSDDAFGRFCFPQKAYEMLACDLPIVATDVGVMSDLLSGFPDLLYAAGDADALARSIARQLDDPVATSIPARDWDSLLPVLENALAGIVARVPGAGGRPAGSY